MAVVSVGEIWQGRTGGRGPDGSLEFIRVFLVITDNPLTESVEVLAAGGIPAYGAVYLVGSSSAAAYCLDRKANQQADDPLGWEVVCRYTSNLPELATSPLSRPPVVSQTMEYLEEPCGEDLDEEPICTSAYEPYDVVTWKWPVLIFTVKANFEEQEPSVYFFPFVDHYGTEDFLGFPGPQVLCESITQEDQTEDGFDFKQRTYVFKVRTDRTYPWKTRVLDQGLVTWDAVNERQVTAYTRDGQPATKPLLLDGEGNLLEIWNDATPVYNEFRLRETADFNTIGLGL